MPTAAFEMAVVHRVFRNELRSAPQLISSVQPGQDRRLNSVADHIANVLAALHHHHMAEDELLWPKLHARIPQRAADIQRMETEHEHIARSAGDVELRLAGWIAANHCTTRQTATWFRATHMLISAVNALTELVERHLSAEEERVVPLINENITDAEWRAITERGGSFISTHNIRFGIAFVGMALEVCTAEERRHFLAGMPPPQRLLAKLFGLRAMTSYRARLGATPTPRAPDVVSDSVLRDGRPTRTEGELHVNRRFGGQH
jgi:hemerythrin-like domain-containing protein